MLEVRRSLGEQPFRVLSTELKVEITASTLREIFFQAVSNSRWAHNAQLAVALKISDAKVVEELERLGASYGISVVSFGLQPQQIDNLPGAAELLNMGSADIEKIFSNVTYETIASGQERDVMDWEHLQDLQSLHPNVKDFLSWIAQCLNDGRAWSWKQWNDIRPPIS